MSSYYLSPEASRARVAALGRRLAAEFRAAPVTAHLEWWFRVPAVLDVVRCHIMDPEDTVALAAAIHRAAVTGEPHD